MRPVFELNGNVTQLGHVATNRNAIALQEPLLRNGRGCNSNGRLAGRRASASAIVAKAVLLKVGIVGMARPKGVGNVGVIFTALILIANE